MKVLVTGADGFIGRHVCQSLAEQDIDFIKGTRDNFSLSDVELMKRTLEESEVTDVIHLAAFADSSDSEKIFDSNLEGLYRLLVAIRETGLKSFVFASSNNVYGEGFGGMIKETEIAQPDINNAYGLSKYAGELLIKDMLGNTDVIYSIMRISDVYGPGQKYGNLVKALVRSVKEHKPIKLFGTGKRCRDYIYVKDVADGLVFACASELRGVYNLSTGVGTDVKTLVGIGVELSGGKCIIENVPVQNEDVSRIVLDPQKLIDAGFKTKIRVEEGLRYCVED